MKILIFMFVMSLICPFSFKKNGFSYSLITASVALILVVYGVYDLNAFFILAPFSAVALFIGVSVLFVLSKHGVECRLSKKILIVIYATFSLWLVY
jgi:hypothetical protein